MKPEKINTIVEKARLAIEAGKYSQAVTTLKKVNGALASRTFQSLSLETLALIKSNKFERALESLTKMKLLNLTKEQLIDMWGNIGKIEKRLGRLDKAIVALEKSIELDSTFNSANNHLVLCELYQETNDFSKLEEIVRRVTKWEAYFAPAQFQLILGSYKQFDKKLVVDNSTKLLNNFRYVKEEYIEGVIDILFNVGAKNEAYFYLRKVQSSLGQRTWMPFLWARHYAENNESKRVIEVISDDLIQSQSTWVKAAECYRLRAIAFEKTKEFDGAFRDFSSMAEVVKINSPRNSGVDYVELLKKINFKELPAYDSTALKYKPIFMVGFPRSGTTLLDSILETQNRVVVLSEVNSISSVQRAFKEKLNKKYPEDLADLNSAEIDILRNVYFEFIDTLGHDLKGKTTIVDKMPLNTIHLPLIEMLFPKAKFIFSLRHPLDVCLSNFQQNYKLNAEMHRLVTMENCVSRYAQVMDLFIDNYSVLKSEILFVKYENLVNDLSAEVDKVFKYIGIEHDDNYSRFHEFAQQKVINTPSSKQVTRGMYSDSILKWKRYRNHIEKYKKELDKYVAKFNYDWN